MPRNSSFSEKLPTLQIYIDSSSLSEFKICPRRYYYSMVLGRQPSAENIHLTFGTLLHKAVEMYHKARFHRDGGLTHIDALRASVKWLMKVTWDKENNRPWSSGDKYKNRFTLIRTVVWYLDIHQEDLLTTALLQDGRPAVELPFTIDSGYSSFTGEEFRLCGTLDRIAIFQPDKNYYVTDIKTTQSTMGDFYFKKFTPDNQVSTYSIAGSIAYNMPVQGLIIDGIQIAIEFSRFERALIERSQSQLTEWQEDLGYWLMNLNHCAETENWPRNDSACNLYGGCPFRAVCSQSNPNAATQVLMGAYRERIWDPLKNRLSF
jgi:PD-(D/E)XK nuclease superfamily